MKTTTQALETINTYLAEIISNGEKIAGIEKTKKGKPLSE